MVLSMLNDRRITANCEVDTVNAIGMHALSLAADAPGACLDWNNNYGEELNKCVLFHCGPTAASLMKPSAILINTARGAVVDNNALAQALKDGKIAGAGIDVYETEPPLPKNHPLLSAPNAVLLPHVAYATREAFDIRADIVMDNIRKWLAKQ